MKKVEAIIRLSRFDAVRDALTHIGIKFFTIHEVKGLGLQKGKTLVYRGSAYDESYIPRLQIDILTTPDKVDAIVEAVLEAGRTGEVGDGKIVIYDVENVIRIRTAERGAQAL